MVTYKQLAYVSRLLQMHQKATNNWKKFLQLAWWNDDVNAEMQAYENLAIDNFYLGQMQKSEYYDVKYKQGDSEAPESLVRKVAIQKIKQSIALQMGIVSQDHLQKQKGKVVKNSFDKMPSPSSFGTISKLKEKPNINQNDAKYETMDRKLKPFAILIDIPVRILEIF